MNKQELLVSVLMLTYNHKDFISQSLESIIMQNYNNIEIIIGDDASTDKTQEILKEYQKKYPDIIKLILHPTNLGITKNSNSVLNECNGKYIFFLAGDDLMLPGKIQKQVEFMEKNHQCSLCYHSLEVFDSDTNQTLFYSYAKKMGTIKEVIKDGTFFGSCSVVLRAKDIPKKGYDNRIPIASDWLICIDTLVNDGTVEYIDEVLGRHRRHSGNITKIRKDYNNEIDLLNTCNIAMLNYPQYAKEALYRYSEILASMRFRDEDKYLHFLKLSLKVNFRLKYFVCFFLYIFSFGKIKK